MNNIIIYENNNNYKINIISEKNKFKITDDIYKYIYFYIVPYILDNLEDNTLSYIVQLDYDNEYFEYDIESNKNYSEYKLRIILKIKNERIINKVKAKIVLLNYLYTNKLEINEIINILSNNELINKYNIKNNFNLEQINKILELKNDMIIVEKFNNIIINDNNIKNKVKCPNCNKLYKSEKSKWYLNHIKICN